MIRRPITRFVTPSNCLRMRVADMVISRSQHGQSQATASSILHPILKVLSVPPHRSTDQTWKVRLIEEEFQRRMFDVSDG